MDYIYPDRPTEETVKTIIRKINTQIKRLGIDFDLEDSDADFAFRKGKDPERPTLPQYMVLYALEWRYLESMKDQSVSPRMNPLAIQRLIMELLDNWETHKQESAKPKESKKSSEKRKRDEAKKIGIHPRLIGDYLKKLKGWGLVKEEEISSKRRIYSTSKPKGFNVLSIWDAIPDLWDTSSWYSFFSGDTTHFNLLLKRFLRFRQKNDFKTLEFYAHRSVARNIPRSLMWDTDDNGNYCLIEGHDFYDRARETAIFITDYLKHSPRQIFENYKDLNENEQASYGSPWFSKESSEFSNWNHLSDNKDESDIAQIYISGLYQEQTMRWQSDDLMKLNTSLFWAEIVDHIKKENPNLTE